MSYLKPRLVIIGLSLIALAIFRPQVFNPGHTHMPMTAITPSPGGEHLAEEGYAALRQTLVSQLQSQYGIQDENILRAINLVPHHLFAPEPDTAHATSGQKITSREGQPPLDPYHAARMIELLQIMPEDKVLVTGNGSAYIAALITEMGVQEVFCIESDPATAAIAASLLERLGYKTISLKQGNPLDGWQENAPYRSILVSQIASHLPSSLSGQMASGGRLVIPILSPQGKQMIWQFARQKNGELTGFRQDDFPFPETGD